jgi:adenylate kinase family enzyme
MAQVDKITREELGKGEWAPELAIRTAVMVRIEEACIKSGDFIIEGFPRKLEQLYLLESIPHIEPIYIKLLVDPITCMRRMIYRKREGDHADAIAMRFRSYQDQTVPMEECIDSVTNYIWGNGSVEEVVFQASRLYKDISDK